MKHSPLKHQITGLARLEGKRNFALFAEMGTGKTYMTLADAERCFIGDKIDALLVIAPNGVHTGWTRREIPMHMSIPTECYTWKGSIKSKKERAKFDMLFDRKNSTPRLRVFSINVEALNFDSGYEAVDEFLKCFRVMMVVDESQKIKNSKAGRTKKIIKLGKLATARRILTGTPLTKGPVDLFSQFEFLRPGLLGTSSERSFVAEYSVLLDPNSRQVQAIMQKTGAKFAPQIIATDVLGNPIFKNLDKLADMIAPHSYRVKKSDCLDLPPKVYKTVYFELEPAQRKVHDRLKADYAFACDLGDFSYEAIAARSKMKQVSSGYINVGGKVVQMDNKENPRLKAFKEVIEHIDGQFIVWAMSKEEIANVMAALEEEGISARAYFGETSKEDRDQAIDDFQAGKFRAFVANNSAAAGITLTAAETAVYYTCLYDLDFRQQSEDRNHRIGTKKTVLYIDIVGIDTIDEDIARSLQMKAAIAARVIDKTVQVT